MKTNYTSNHQPWDLSLWFAILSPIIGIAIGVLGLMAFAR